MKTIEQKYDSKIKDLGNYGSGNVMYSFGPVKGKKLLREAIDLDAYIEVIYDMSACDKIDKINFISHKNNKIIKSIP